MAHGAASSVATEEGAEVSFRKDKPLWPLLGQALVHEEDMAAREQRPEERRGGQQGSIYSVN